ncbi:MAG: glycosyltransferase family 1 protein [Brevinematales bacterium]|nr:glycosyltransferase family 1 protein [Brevinematales bacterium]
MKILHIGYFNDHELGGDIIFSKGLRMNGCDVTEYDYPDLMRKKGRTAADTRLSELIPGNDLIFIGKGQYLETEAIRSIKTGKIPVALWYGDIRIPVEPWLKELLGSVDYFFMSSGGELLREYKRQGNPRIAAYFFNPSDPDIPIKYASLTPPQRYPVVMSGSPYGFADHERLATVRYLRKRRDVRFYGGIEELVWKTNPFSRILRKSLKAMKIVKSSEWVRGEKYIAAIKSADIGVGVSAFQQIDKYTSDRLSHYLTFGTFYLPWKFPRIGELFEYGKELVWFEGTDDLDKKISHYLANPEERYAIARAGQQKMLEEYNTRNITAMMLDVISTGKSDRFPWVEINT